MTNLAKRRCSWLTALFLPSLSLWRCCCCFFFFNFSTNDDEISEHQKWISRIITTTAQLKRRTRFSRTLRLLFLSPSTTSCRRLQSQFEKTEVKLGISQIETERETVTDCCGVDVEARLTFFLPSNWIGKKIRVWFWEVKKKTKKKTKCWISDIPTLSEAGVCFTLAMEPNNERIMKKAKLVSVFGFTFCIFWNSKMQHFASTFLISQTTPASILPLSHWLAH